VKFASSGPKRVKRVAKASLLIGAGDTELSENGYANCRFASNLEVNVLYCDGGKLIVQDAI
jgi:prepilin-type processing-associated H-X9-DG protein